MDYLKENLIIELQNILAALMRGALPSVYAYVGTVVLTDEYVGVPCVYTTKTDYV